MSTENLKKELEAALSITDWSPTESELHEIARRINSLSCAAPKIDIEHIVLDVVGSIEFISMEGADNTDLTTLLLLATKTTKK
ncbi:hypothetical protein [Pseudoalteromonas gelatinilytica]|uniref:Uncharacterized protein n=1 Tax=Pseudoalteromonas gelatinilytica TaxID=1703256 RepID=A0A3A3EMG1_9GAMM|nr:hypothetical protein [Pseudoalteromonas profundi]RJF37550.1 hypothetical protein D4741_05620 [Pseudoalteromonas profundi]